MGRWLAMMILSVLSVSIGTGCQSAEKPSLKPVSYVDVPHFMGDWYVIAAIPTFFERNAYNPVESYELQDDGTIATTFTFNKGGFDGPLKRYEPTGHVLDKASNAVWGMQFIWPFKADYQIIYLNADYQTTVIGREKRDYVWMMARTPQIDDAIYQSLQNFIAEQGYDMTELRKMPQQPLSQRGSR